MKKLAFMILVVFLGYTIAQDSKDSHQTSSEWEMMDFMQGDEVENKKEALDSCYTTQNSTQNCAKILADWESLCAYGGVKYCIALFRIYESLRKDKKALDKIIATLRQQCDSKQSAACLALGEFYERQAGAKKPLPYFQKACDLGFSSSCGFIVSRYLYGEFQHLDKKQIRLYFDKALQTATRDCQRGEKTACEMIRDEYELLQSKIDLMR